MTRPRDAAAGTRPKTARDGEAASLARGLILVHDGLKPLSEEMRRRLVEAVLILLEGE